MYVLCIIVLEWVKNWLVRQLLKGTLYFTLVKCNCSSCNPFRNWSQYDKKQQRFLCLVSLLERNSRTPWPQQLVRFAFDSAWLFFFLALIFLSHWCCISASRLIFPGIYLSQLLTENRVLTLHCVLTLEQSFKHCLKVIASQHLWACGKTLHLHNYLLETL